MCGEIGCGGPPGDDDDDDDDDDETFVDTYTLVIIAFVGLYDYSVRCSFSRWHPAQPGSMSYHWFELSRKEELQI